MRKFLLTLCVALILFLSGCSNETAHKKDDAPAGHPDELKDSTRLDPAPKQAESKGNGPE